MLVIFLAGKQLIFLLRIFHPHLSLRVRSHDIFFTTGPSRVSGQRADGPSNAADAAPSRGFAPAVRSRESDIVAAGSVPDSDVGVLSRDRRDASVGGSSRLLAALEFPEGSVVLCVDGILTSIGGSIL